MCKQFVFLIKRSSTNRGDQTRNKFRNERERPRIDHHGVVTGTGTGTGRFPVLTPPPPPRRFHAAHRCRSLAPFPVAPSHRLLSSWFRWKVATWTIIRSTPGAGCCCSLATLCAWRGVCLLQFLLLLLLVVVHVIVVVVAVQFYFDSCNPAVNIVVNCNSASRCRDAPPFGRE